MKINLELQKLISKNEIHISSLISPKLKADWTHIKTHFSLKIKQTTHNVQQHQSRMGEQGQ